jgi:hypothetical protein
MGGSLQDQLLKAGLVDARKAKQLESEQRKQGRQQRAAASQRDRAAAEQAQAEKAERDRELNRRREEEARRRALSAEIDDLVRAHQVPSGQGELAYNFADGRLVKRVYVTDAQRRQLAGGQLAIVRHGPGYALVPAEIAGKVRERDAARVVVLNAPQAREDPDDPYAQYRVPDDLMW